MVEVFKEVSKNKEEYGINYRKAASTLTAKQIIEAIKSRRFMVVENPISYS